MKTKKKVGIIELAMRSRNVVIAITVVLMLIGVVALKKMPRNEFPQFTIRQGVIVGVYPGATSAEVEEQLTKVVENYIFGYKEVKKAKTYSYSREGIMYIFVELNDDVKNADQFWSKMKHGLSELKMSLPTGVLALIANADFGDTSALLITLSSDTRSYKEMEQQLKKLEAECRKIPATSKIKHYGLQKEKIFVQVDPVKLNEYNIKTLSLLGSYQSNGMVNYAGVLKDGKNNLAVHLPTNFQSEKDLSNQIVYSDPNGNVVRLKDIASIERRYDKPDDYIKQNGRKTILLSLEMQPGNNIVEFGEDVEKALEHFKKQAPQDITISKISEMPKYVDDSVSNFMHEFLIAIIAVILVTMVLLPFRVASVAGITVPISVLLTLCFLYFLGVELHTVSLASLILVLGMIVDNSIVVIDNHVEKIDHGFSVWHSAIKSAKELVVPIIVATLAIMAAYFPLGFMVPGTSGEFMNTIPIVVTVALIVSVAVALFLVPYLNFVFIKKGLNKTESKQHKKTFLDRLQAWFDTSLEAAFRHYKLILVGTVLLLIIAVVIFKNLDQQLFPEMERNQFAVEVYLPTGSSLESTATVIDSLEHVLLQDKRVVNVTSFVGTSSPRFHTVYAPNMPASNYGQLLVNTISDKATRGIVSDYSKTYSNNFVNAHTKWKILAMQLNKASIEIRITSDSINDIRNVQSNIEAILRKTKNVAWVRNDWDDMQQNVRVNLDNDKANRMGYTKGFVASSLMVGLDGVPLTTIWENDYPVEVRLTQESGSTKNFASLENQYITSPSSFAANPLRSFATLTPEWTQGTIAHRNGTRTVTIAVDNEMGTVASETFNEIRPQIEALTLPEGTSISYGGDYEGQVEVFIPMGIALGLSIVLIFFILLIQFKKEKLSFLILSTMLLALPGAAIGLVLVQYPFSITAFIGITSLCGMVVRNGIILIDYARELHEVEKYTVHEAAIAAGKRRMRPIFLTAAAAAVGVVPMILSRSPLWGPLGTVICFGLLISMVLTLYVLPILYYVAYSDKQKKRNRWTLPSAGVGVVLLFALPMIPNNAQAQTISLDSCKQMALRNNHKIKESNYELQQSKEVKRSAFTNYFPKVSADAMAIKANDALIKGTVPEMNLPVYNGDPASLSTATQFGYFPGMKINALDNAKFANITIAQPLFAGGRIYYGNKLASISTQISEQKQQLTAREVLQKTDESYYTHVSLLEKQKTLQSYDTLLNTLLKDVSVAVKAGLVQRADLLKVQLKKNEIELRKKQLNNGISLSKRALCQHIGLAFTETVQFDTSLALASAPQAYYVDAQQAASQRLESQMLNSVVEVNRLQKRMIRGENLPQVSVGAIGMYQDLMNTSSTNAIGFVSLSIPLSDWWGGSHKLKEQSIKIDAAQNKLQETTELLVLQITQAQNELDETFFQIETTEKSKSQAQENYKVTMDNYKAGVATMADLLEAQALYQAACDSVVDARCQYQIKLSKYLYVVSK